MFTVHKRQDKKLRGWSNTSFRLQTDPIYLAQDIRLQVKAGAFQGMHVCTPKLVQGILKAALSW